MNIHTLIKNATVPPFLKMKLDRGKITQSKANLILLADAITDLNISGKLTYEQWRDLILDAHELTTNDYEYSTFYLSQTSSYCTQRGQHWGNIHNDRRKRGIKIIDLHGKHRDSNSSLATAH
jgi:hypothetical protein